ENSKSKDEYTDHSARVWKRLDYKIKYAESYSYKFYGNKIFTPEQVEKIGSNYQIKYSETGLTRKLLKDTGLKQLTKKLLINNYGLSRSKANELVLYN
ncbi:MAG: hypothetical protein U9N30_07495, partial [Campylobacterota bacterium]|nr:hypothetical protein [Campylobacterota bacterium]